MAGPATSQPTPQRLAAIREQLSLLADYLDPPALKDRVEALERQMGEPGFWDDPRPARVGSTPRAETRRLTTYEQLAGDVDDLEGLVELAEEDPEFAAEVEQAFAAVETRLGGSRRSGCSPAPTTPATRSSPSTPAPAAPTPRTRPRWCCAW